MGKLTVKQIDAANREKDNNGLAAMLHDWEEERITIPTANAHTFYERHHKDHS